MAAMQGLPEKLPAKSIAMQHEGKSMDTRQFNSHPLVDQRPGPTLPLPDTDPLRPTAVGLLALGSHHCRWPVGRLSGSDQQFCGATKTDGGAYCAAHARMGYVPARPMRV
jgi:hypothetical protein